MDDAARMAVERAQEEWKCWRLSRILDYMRLGVLDNRTALGNYQWCGAFAAYCWQDVHPEIRKHLWPSVYRLLLYANYGIDKNLWPAEMAARFPRTEPPRVLIDVRLISDRKLIRPGDVCLVGSGEPHHIAIATIVADGFLHTISGNGLGLLASNMRGRGVAKNLYPWPQVWYAIRPAPGDLVEKEADMPCGGKKGGKKGSKGGKKGGNK